MGVKSFLEKWHPLFIGMGIAIAGFHFLEIEYVVSSKKEILSATLTLGSINVGFLATAKAILFSISSSNVARQMKETGVFQQLINYLLDGINWSFTLALYSLLGLMIDLNHNFESTYLQIWLIILSVSVLSVHRFVRLLTMILKR